MNFSAVSHSIVMQLRTQLKTGKFTCGCNDMWLVHD